MFKDRAGLPPVLAPRDETDNELFRYIDGFYNTEHIQKDLGWLSPDEYEAAWHTAQTEPATIPAAPTTAR